ncbi:hypothetical protein AVS7_04271, partial [Acidovorax sp. MR-S7]
MVTSAEACNCDDTDLVTNLDTKQKALSQICVDDRHSDGVEQELARL